MPKYKSKPHEIDAFQFKTDVKVVPPKWFIEAVKNNKAQVTMSEKYGYYISIYTYDESGKQIQMEKAFKNYWICRADHGKIYVLDDKSFKESYDA